MAREADPLAAASGIGDRLVRAGVWYRGHCNWVGPDGAAQRALGPGLGGGTAGVALFLSQLHAATGDPAARQAALGALGQALGHADEAHDRGLMTGRLGIAVAAARCAPLLGEPGLATRAARLARARPVSRAADFGVLSGVAGEIAGLLALARLLGDERLARRAAGLGDELCAGARRGAEGWSWPPPAPHHMHGLCGIADGAAGAAWALLELFAAGGDDRHRAAAQRALDYERHWFDPEAVNWPDLRGIERRERRGSFRPPLLASWSHGAPGIALTRLRAHAILGDERSREEAATALATTAAAVQRALLDHGASFTLADGLAGTADVLLHAPEHAPLAHRVGDVAAGRYAGSVDGWPCGAGDGFPPGLLGGHAGIGLFYLRLHDPTLPSPLLPV
ncbi:MAG TPA: lanthionine synthetase LanC family protein [Solirubrobacteraceae bacterium]|nr:lanthionine synthetase LanC family protein [Solirubrobacteraceae bacterium]